jgi:fructosamine-3-kinase
MKLEKNGQSILAICEEEWEVSTGKKSYTLNSAQAQALKEVTSNGGRGLVWFDKFAVSIPHIVSVELVKKTYYKLEDNLRINISRDEYERLSGKLLA